MPTVLARFIQQAWLQVLPREWDRTFSHFSFGFRPNRSAHQAVALSPRYLNEGSIGVVDRDLEKFFDRVNHDVRMSRVKGRVQDKRVLKLINRDLNAGALAGGLMVDTPEGTPQGGPLSPLLGNRLLDDLDKEREKRGLRFVRYADDGNLYVNSHRAGERVLASISRWLWTQLKLPVNEQKSAVERPWNRSFLGFPFSRTRKRNRRKVSEESLNRFKHRIRALTRRTRGRTLAPIIGELRPYLLGWKAYFGFAEVVSPLRDLDKGIRRRLRCYIWKQWGRSGYRQRRKQGVKGHIAWNTAKSAHGPWRITHSPALYYALPKQSFLSPLKVHG